MFSFTHVRRLGINQQFEFQQLNPYAVKVWHVSQSLCRKSAQARDLLHPTSLLGELSTITQLFGPHPWPGQSEETVTSWDRTVRVLRGIELFTLVVCHVVTCRLIT